MTGGCWITQAQTIQISTFIISFHDNNFDNDEKWQSSDTDQNGSLPIYFAKCKSSANLFWKEQRKIEVFTVCHN